MRSGRALSSLGPSSRGMGAVLMLRSSEKCGAVQGGGARFRPFFGASERILWEFIKYVPNST
jgi:hypothetical protein